MSIASLIGSRPHFFSWQGLWFHQKLVHTELAELGQFLGLLQVIREVPAILKHRVVRKNMGKTSELGHGIGAPFVASLLRS